LATNLQDYPSASDFEHIRGNYTEALDQIRAATDPSSDEFCEEFTELCSQKELDSVEPRQSSNSVQSIINAASSIGDIYQRLSPNAADFSNVSQATCSIIQLIAVSSAMHARTP
jgi:hypothetical protein